ncbi:MAG: T9SS type A sorting domain-containing protein [bacterium]
MFQPVLPVNTTVTVAGHRYAYYWNYDYGRPTSDNTRDPRGPVIFTYPGAPYISIMVHDSDAYGGAGGDYYYRQSITVLDLPTATIEATPRSAALNCIADSVILVATPSDTLGHILWTRPTGFTDTNETIAARTSGNYQVIATDRHGCSSNYPTSIWVNGGTPVHVDLALATSYGGIISTDTSVSVCSSDGRILQPIVSGAMWPITYNWNDGSTASTDPIATSGYYWVKLTDANGCIGRDTIHVTRNITPPNTITPSTSATLCSGDSLILRVASGYSYSWSTWSGVVSTSDSVIVTSSNYYSVQINGLGGCNATNTYNANFNAAPTPSIEIFPNVGVSHSGPIDTVRICSNASSSMYASSAVYSTTLHYVWNTGDTTANLPLRSGGLKRVTITTAEGCSASKSIFVVMYSAPDSSYTLSNLGPLCDGTTQVVRLRRAPGNSYTWSTGGIADSAILTSSATITAVITSARGCMSPVTYTAVFNATPHPVVSAGPCSMEAGTITSGNRYQWSTPTGIIPGATSAFYGATTGGFYSYKETTPLGCNATATMTYITCGGTTGTGTSTDSVHAYFAEDATLSCGTGYLRVTNLSTAILPSRLKYFWSFDGGTPATSNLQNPPPILFSPGLHFVNLVARDTVNGSTSTYLGSFIADTLKIRAYGYAPTTGRTSFDTLPVCPNDSAWVGALIYAGAGVSYQWNNGDSSARFVPHASGMYSVHVTDNRGCSADDSVYLSVSNFPDSSITRSSLSNICAGDTLRLSLHTGNSYQWNTYDTTSSIGVTTPGYYSVRIMNRFGCVSHANANITFNPKPIPSVTVSGARFSYGIFDTAHVCANANPSISIAPSGMTYHWNTGSSFSNFPLTVNGVYTATVTNSYGCKAASNPVYVNIHSSPDSLITVTRVSACMGDSISLGLSPGNSYSWSTGERSNGINVFTSGTYSVTVTTDAGCVSHATKSVTFNPLPNVTIGISPMTLYTFGGGTDTAHACSNTHVNISATTGTGNTYQWNNGSTFSSFLIPLSGLYTVTVTNTYACSASAQVYVNIHSAPDSIIMPSKVSVCKNDTLILWLPSGNHYLWNTGSDNDSIMVFDNGIFSATVSNIYGCESHTLPYTATFHSIPKPEIAASSCNLSLLSIASGSTYQWYEGSNPIWINASSYIVTANDWYSVEETTSEGCRNRSNSIFDSACVIPIPIDSCKSFPIQSPSIVIDVTNCMLGCSSKYTVDSFVWTRSGIFLPATDTPYISSFINGLYQVTVYDTRGCSATSELISAGCVQDTTHAPINFDVYPNPFSQHVTITCDSTFSVLVFNMLGQKVLETMENNGVTLQTGQWRPDTYFIVVGNRFGVVTTKKVVKTK